MSEKTNPYRERKWYQIGTGALIALIASLVIPIPFIMSMYSMRVYTSLVVYIIVWGYLVFLIIHFVRSSRTNVYHIVDESVIRKTITDIKESRVTRKHEFIEREIEHLRQGKKIPVLDIWKTDSSLAMRHSYFSRVVHCAIDPKNNELEMLIQLSAIPIPAPEHRQLFRNQFMHRITEFLIHASQDLYLVHYQPFFTVIILQCNSLREDEKGYDVPYPIFSMLISKAQLNALASTPTGQEHSLDRFGDVRFSYGMGIVPHQVIAPL